MWLKHLSVISAPGFEHGRGPELKELTPGINIIIGPNGSGKSTLCRSISYALWPELNSRASWTVFESTWQLADASIKRNYQGRELSADSEREISLPASNLAACFSMQLSDLLLEQPESDLYLAKEVTRLLSGGYDLAALDALTRYQFSPKRARVLAKSLREREQDYRNSKALYEQAAREFEKLPEIEAKLAKSENLRIKLDYLNILLEKFELKNAQTLLEQKQASFNPALAELSGSELEQFDRLNEERQQKQTLLKKLSEELARLSTKIREARFKDKSVRQQLSRLQSEIDRLRSLEQDLNQLNESEYEQRARENALLERFPELNVSALNSLSLADINELETAFSTQLRLQSEIDTLSQRADTLAAEIDIVSRDLQSDQNPAVLIPLYQEWLNLKSSIQQSRRIYWPTVLLALIALGSSLFLSLRVDSLFALLSLPVVLLLIAGLRENSGARNQKISSLEDLIRRSHTADFAFERDEVQRHLGALQYQQLLHQQHAGLLSLRADTLGRLDSLKKSLERSTGGEQSVLDTLKDLALDQRLTFLSLSQLLAESLRARVQLTGLQSMIATKQNDYDLLKSAINTAFLKFGMEAIANSAQALSALRVIEQEFQDFCKLLDSEQSFKERQMEQEAEVSLLDQQLDQLCQRLGLRADEARVQLQSLIQDLQDFREFEKQLFATRKSNEQLEQKLQMLSHADFEYLNSKNQIELQKIREVLMQETSSRELLLQEHSRIIEKKRSLLAHFALEEKFAEVLSEREKLEDQQRMALRSALAQNIKTHLLAKQEHRNLPAVFQKAADFFTRFTRGAYKLLPPDSQNAQAQNQLFRALESSSLAELPLSKLSSGARTQLLIAARAAFALSQDAHEPLPLIFDEALSSSDPLRFRAIADSLIELAQDGRQILYFSCQPQDAEMWQLVARESSYELLKVHQLNPETTQTLEFSGSLFVPADQRFVPSQPRDQESYKQYVQRIGTPALPALPSAERVHLAYILDDSRILYELLQSGILTVGQYERVAEHDSRSLPLSPAQRQMLSMRIQILRATIDAIRSGRGLPLSAQILSEVCKTNQLEKIVEKAALVHWDANALLERIDPDRGKELANFRKNTYLQIHEALHDRGFATDSKPLEKDEARALVLSQVRRDYSQEYIPLADSVFEKVWQAYQDSRLHP